MTTINMKDARSQFKTLLDRVEAGEQIAIARRGKVVAQLVPPARRAGRLPPLKTFRAGIRIAGRALSKSVIEHREEETA